MCLCPQGPVPYLSPRGLVNVYKDCQYECQSSRKRRKRQAGEGRYSSLFRALHQPWSREERGQVRREASAAFHSSAGVYGMALLLCSNW